MVGPMLREPRAAHVDAPVTGTDWTPANAQASTRTRGRLASDSPDGWQTIVVGYDGSDPAKRALAHAGALATERTKMVAEPYPRSGVTVPANEDAAEIQRRRSELDAARRFLSRMRIKPETVALRGDPAKIFVDASNEADLVIVGSRKPNRLQRLVLRSVSSKVVHDAASDVLVVR